MTKIKALLILVILICINCGSSQNAQQNTPPPAGTLWENNFGYTDVYAVVDEMPEPIGGNVNFLKYIQQGLSDKECRKRSNVINSVVLSKRGEVIDVHTINAGVDKCDKYASELISNYPFKPGKHEGEYVKTVLSFRINFK